MIEIGKQHMERLRTAVLANWTMASMSRWIQEHTRLGGAPYSYFEHEYQQTILNDTSTHLNVRKCSQVGLSEVSARLALGMTNMLSPFTTIYTLPTAKFAGTFVKTRIDPVVDGSAMLKANIHKTTDNADLKRFGESYLYVRGAASTNAPISIPADMLIHDEFDFCDQSLLTQYTSRLTHSRWKLVRRFSTPTLPGFGIDREFQSSRRFFNLCKCDHCNEWFNPSYYEHIVIPGFDGDLHNLTKADLAVVKWADAWLKCPKCGLRPNLGPDHREFVCENPSEPFPAAGYQVSPFDVPSRIKPSDLVLASTSYERRQDFDNYNLGLPAQDTDATLVLADFDGVFLNECADSGVHVMGVDVGATYHFTVAKVMGDGSMLFVHTQRVVMGDARGVYHALRKRFRVVCTVMDSLPHGETVMALQAEDPTLFAARYTKSAGLTVYDVVHREPDKAEGRQLDRRVNINRNLAFDNYMRFLRSGQIHIMNTEERGVIQKHHMSMKRARVWDDDGAISFNWVKTDGEDHYHHAFLYAYVAGMMRGASGWGQPLPLGLVHSFKLKDKRLDESVYSTPL